MKYQKEDLPQVNPQLYEWLATINDKSSYGNIVSQDNDFVKDTENSKNNTSSNANLLKNEDFNKLDVNSAIESTIYKQFKENDVELFEKEYGGKGFSRFSERLIENYKKTGDIGVQERAFFEDNGEAVARAISNAVEKERGGGNVKNISDRTFEEVGSRKVLAFQYTYPQLKKYYTPIAKELLRDIQDTVRGERFVISDGIETKFSGQKRLTSEAIEKIKDGTGKSYDNISDALNRLINDEGQENIALAKRIELVIDDMLTDGYTSFDGTEVPPNENYIEEKSHIEENSNKAKDGAITEKAVSSENIATDNSVADLTDKCELITTKHTATGDDIWVVTLKDKLSSEEYKDLNGKVKAVGGYYSRFAKDTDGNAIPGFVFKTEPTGKEISVFNDFFKKETVATENEKNIAEYFNTEIDVMCDITGKKVSTDILKATKNSVVKNEHGQLIPVYHGTDTEFEVFNRSDIGIHFGSYPQAVQRVTDKKISEPKYKKAYLNIENPLIIDEDFFGWNASQIVSTLDKMGILTRKESRYLSGNLGQNQLNTAPPALISVYRI